MIAPTRCTLWKKTSNQSCFRPEDLHITHVSFYAVDARFVHKEHLGVNPEPMKLGHDAPVNQIFAVNSYEKLSTTLDEELKSLPHPEEFTMVGCSCATPKAMTNEAFEKSELLKV